MTIELQCNLLRQDILNLGAKCAALHSHAFFQGEDRVLDGAHIPLMQHANMHANITLAFRCLEDARMRLGKVMQACQGGVSIFDKEGDGPSDGNES
jgi:hypothetical protein